MKFRILLSILLVFSAPVLLISQDHRFSSLKVYEDSLQILQESIYSDKSIAIRELECNRFVSLFKDALNTNGSFQYPWDSLKHIGKITSDDGKVRVYTMNLPLPNGEQKYFGFIQHFVNKKTIQLFELKDNRQLVSDPINEILTPEKWYGSLYYSIISKSIKGGKTYILLGIDFNNLFSSKKLVEVLNFSKAGEPVFGAPVFKVGQNKLNRIVFEYSAKASMILRYNEEDGVIVFDHLSPSRPDFTGNYQFYGPDFTYDGFKFDGENWVYIQDLDLRNPNRERKKVTNTPEKLPEPGFLYKSNAKY